MPVLSVRFTPEAGLPASLHSCIDKAGQSLAIVTGLCGPQAVREAGKTLQDAFPRARVLCLGTSGRAGGEAGREPLAPLPPLLTVISGECLDVFHQPANGAPPAMAPAAAASSFVSHYRQQLDQQILRDEEREGAERGSAALLVLSALPVARSESLAGELREHQPDTPLTLIAAGQNGWIYLDGSMTRGGLAVVALPASLPLPDPGSSGSLHHGQLSLTDQRVFYRTIIEEMSDGVALLDQDGVILYESPSNARIHGWEDSSLAGRNACESLIHPEDVARVQQALKDLRQNPQDSLSLELRLRHCQGHWVTVHLGGRNCLHLPQIRAIVCTFRDISAQKAVEEQLRHLVITDSLTGVSSRRHFMETAETELARAGRHHSPLTIALFDLDHFKGINDRFGHATGDSVLRHVGEACRKTLRREDMVGRMGGEEFALLMPETDLKTGFLVAERLRCAISGETPAGMPAGEVATASFGLAQACLPENDVDALLARADSALYTAKKNGRNCCAMSPPPLALKTFVA